jgi:hypothetical protein
VKALAVLLLAAMGCVHPPRADSLADSVRNYNDGVRWERFTAAATAVPPKERDDFLDEREQLARDLRITDYEIVRLKDEGERATVQVKVSWYRTSQGTLHETWSRQSWERHGRVWRIVAEARVRGDEMPGLPEGASGADKTDTGIDAGL